ncbi:uncharacterized protein VTP21DRAFT_6713 [Calcarisporiella thermophila]|uniref:uncharacterized protein n=1 Tax=Calcarisporiella thermophila TaxID=911321 RepID=UPI003744A9E5
MKGKISIEHFGVIAIITVGLPARGKTHIARSLTRYLRWLGIQTRVFSVGNYRRQLVGTKPNEFFSPGNEETSALRKKVADTCLEDMIQWLTTGGGQVGIYDASNTLEERRRELVQRLNGSGIQIVFIESICDKPEIIDANIRSVKISSPDYVGWDPEEAVCDFKNRINNHVPFYQTITDNSVSYAKVMNAGERIISNNINGYLQTRIVYYLMNLHISPRIIYFARTGESLNESSYKADAELSPAGHRYAEALKNFLLGYRDRARNLSSDGWETERPLTVWTSARKRSVQTAQHFEAAGIFVRNQTLLTDINPGECDGLTPQQIREKFPEEFERAQQDPYHHRYPRAESYHDLAVRLEGCILELEREKNDVLIIAHDSVLRCLYAYLFGRPESEIPKIAIPRNYLIEIRPSAYGCREKRLEIPVGVVNEEVKAEHELNQK